MQPLESPFDPASHPAAWVAFHLGQAGVFAAPIIPLLLIGPLRRRAFLSVPLSIAITAFTCWFAARFTFQLVPMIFSIWIASAWSIGAYLVTNDTHARPRPVRKPWTVWQRLSVVLFGLWVVVSAIFWTPQLMGNCEQAAPSCDYFMVGSGASTAFWGPAQALQLWRLGLWGNAIYATLVFPVLVALLLWALVRTAQWVLAGWR